MHLARQGCSPGAGAPLYPSPSVPPRFVRELATQLASPKEVKAPSDLHHKKAFRGIDENSCI